MIAVAGIVFGGVRYFLHMQDQMKQMAANNAKLEMVAEENEIMMNNMIAETQRMNELSDDLRNRLDAAKQYQNDLIAKLKKHDLSKLSYAKPGLIEKRINNETPNTPNTCLLYTSPSPRDRQKSRMPSSA